MGNKPITTDLVGNARLKTSVLNDNSEIVNSAIEGVLGRGGTAESTNSMYGNIDMDLNKIINLGAPTTPAGAARLQDISDSDATGAASATLRSDVGAALDVDTYSDLRSTGIEFTVAIVKGRDTIGDSGHGIFRWNPADLSTEVTADTLSGFYVAPNLDLTGASGAWVREILHIVYPEWFGTPVTTAIAQAAVTAAPTGTTVVFSADEYDCDDTIDVKTGSKLQSFGSWFTGTVGNSNLYLIDIDGVDDIGINGFRFQRGSKLVADSKYSIHLTNEATRVNIGHSYFFDSYGGIVSQLETDTNLYINVHDCHFDEMGNGGVFINNRGTVGVKVYDSLFTHCGYTQSPAVIGTGIEIRGNSGTIVNNCHFYNFTDNTSPNDGIRVENVSEAVYTKGEANIVANCVLKTIAGNGIRVIDNDDTILVNNQIDGITVTGVGGSGFSGNGILLSFATNGDFRTKINNNVIQNVVNGIRGMNGIITGTQIGHNTILVCSENGIYGDFSEADMYKNLIKECDSLACIRLGTSGGNNVVSHNDLWDGTATYGGIAIASPDNIIAYNDIRDSRGSIIHDHGINIFAAVTGNRLIENRVRDFNTNRVFLEGTTAFAGTIMRQNVAVPGAKDTTCNPGDYATDDDYIYEAKPTDQFTFNWKRVALDNSAW